MMVSPFVRRRRLAMEILRLRDEYGFPLIGSPVRSGLSGKPSAGSRTATSDPTPT